jgi:hypothetical protein
MVIKNKLSPLKQQHQNESHPMRMDMDFSRVWKCHVLQWEFMNYVTLLGTWRAGLLVKGPLNSAPLTASAHGVAQVGSGI